LNDPLRRPRRNATIGVTFVGEAVWIGATRQTFPRFDAPDSDAIESGVKGALTVFLVAVLAGKEWVSATGENKQERYPFISEEHPTGAAGNNQPGFSTRAGPRARFFHSVAIHGTSC
jgi:hypothetical protein